MDGQLSRHPLAELIREIIDSKLSGALRLSREAAKAVVYFDSGEPSLAASNLRAHRLREILARKNITCPQLEKLPATASDEELSRALIASGELKLEILQQVRGSQASDVLRVALLWTDGDWQFNQKVRIPTEMRVKLDSDRLLLESARHLPFPFVKKRVENAATGYSLGTNNGSINLLPAESFVLSRATAAGDLFKLSDISPNGLSEEDYLRGVYALSLSGILHRSDWDSALNPGRTDKDKSRRATGSPVANVKQSAPDVDSTDVHAFLARMKTADRKSTRLNSSHLGIS